VDTAGLDELEVTVTYDERFHVEGENPHSELDLPGHTGDRSPRPSDEARSGM
jgi:hypothetical protein